MISHGMRVFDLGPDPLARLVPGHDLSSLGLIMFFAISGHLVGQSARRLPPGAFLRNRALRILPGLAVCLMVTVFGIGALATDLPPGSYVTQVETWAYFLNLALFPLQTELPGVFLANPWSDHVNGSLWTLAIEGTAYCLALVASLSRRRAPWVLAALAMGAALWFLWMEATGAFYLWYVERVVAGEPLFLFYLNKFGLAQLLFVFLLGAAMADLPRPRLWLALGALGLSLLVAHPLAVGAAGACVTLALGRMGTVRLRHDLSYGLYLYHLPVLQLVWTLGHDRLPLPGMIALGAGLTLCLAGLSWVFVERPALSRRAKQGPAT